MFDKLDQPLFTARIIMYIMLALSLLAFVAFGIYLIYLFPIEKIFVGIAVTLLGSFLSWLEFVFCNLILSYLCDIKLIRNKLYGDSNENLAIFYNEETTIPTMQEMREEVESDEVDQLINLRDLLASGAITEEEFQEEAKKLI